MSTYLDRLKQLDGENNYQHTPDMELTKPPKAPFVSFGGTGTGHIEKKNNDETGKSWMWKVLMPDRELTVTTIPESTHSEIREIYPAAIGISPAIFAIGTDEELSSF